MAPTRCLVSDQVPSHIRADESFVQQIHRRFAGGRYWNCPIADDLRGIHPLAVVAATHRGTAQQSASKQALGTGKTPVCRCWDH